jgi:hypothetical protein
MLYEYPHTLTEIAANHWEECSEDQFTEMLCCVPPFRQEGNGFAVGEPLCHCGDEEVCDVYVVCGGKYWHKPQRLCDFDVNKFRAEIMTQVKT